MYALYRHLLSSKPLYYHPAFLASANQLSRFLYNQKGKGKERAKTTLCPSSPPPFSWLCGVRRKRRTEHTHTPQERARINPVGEEVFVPREGQKGLTAVLCFFFLFIFLFFVVCIVVDIDLDDLLDIVSRRSSNVLLISRFCLCPHFQTIRTDTLELRLR